MNKYETMTDEQLIRALRDGERGVMDFIMVKYKSMVRKKARAMFLLGGENEDLIQEGMRRRGLHLQVLPNFVYQDRCIRQSKHPGEKSTFLLTLIFHCMKRVRQRMTGGMFR